MRLYEQYYMDGNTRVFVDFFVGQPGDTMDHSGSLPPGHALEQVNVNRLRQVVAEILLGTSLEGLRLNALRRATLSEIYGYVDTLRTSGSDVDFSAYETLNRLISRYEAFEFGPREN